MPVHNRDIADVLNRAADLLEIRGDNPFRIRAYRNAARTVQSLSESAADIVSEGGDLTRFPGIGKDLAGSIQAIIETGDFPLLKDLRKEVPEELSQLMNVSGLGAKRIAKLYKELEITSLGKLKKAISDGRVRDLEGFGEKTEQNILHEIERLESDQTKGTKLVFAEDIAEPLIQYLKKGKGVQEICVAGSFRRRKETVRDLDILVTCKGDSDIMDRFTHYEDVEEVVSKGKTRSTVLLRSNFQVDLRLVQQVSYGAALVYFTGSKEHNIAIRKLGIKKKLKLNEYGVFRGKKRVAGKTEAEVYKTIDLPYIEPELRENRGELEAAGKGTLPELVSLEAIQGDLHVHSQYTDGRNTIEEMVQAARERGYKYVAITDHSKHVSVAHGLHPKDIRKQWEEIDKLNERLKGIAILKGTEVDILEDGRLDWPDEILKELDVRVCSVHYKFNLSKQKQTERIIRAMDNPYFTILGHPSGRLIQERDPYEVDMHAIIKAAGQRGCFLELNAHPDRLDLNDIYCRMAKELGVQVVISTDAHQTAHLPYMRFGIYQARRGWL